jgi:hypothetical protein
MLKWVICDKYQRILFEDKGIGFSKNAEPRIEPTLWMLYIATLVMNRINDNIGPV